MCVGFCWVPIGEPSPKSQTQPLTAQPKVCDASVNVTVSGFLPTVGVALKLAIGSGQGDEEAEAEADALALEDALELAEALALALGATEPIGIPPIDPPRIAKTESATTSTSPPRTISASGVNRPKPHHSSTRTCSPTSQLPFPFVSTRLGSGIYVALGDATGSGEQLSPAASL